MSISKEIGPVILMAIFNATDVDLNIENGVAELLLTFETKENDKKAKILLTVTNVTLPLKELK